MSIDEKERAKQIIVEIIRQSGGEFHNKTNMYKAFWKSHLEFARQNPGYLSLWPIVRMPNGPGIDDFDRLIGELMSDGIVEADQVEHGGYKSFRFKLKNPNPLPRLSGEEEAAIQQGVSFVEGRSAASVSNHSHDLSRSWNDAKNDGDEPLVVVEVFKTDNGPGHFSE